MGQPEGPPPAEEGAGPLPGAHRSHSGTLTTVHPGEQAVVAHRCGCAPGQGGLTGTAPGPGNSPEAPRSPDAQELPEGGARTWGPRACCLGPPALPATPTGWDWDNGRRTFKICSCFALKSLQNTRSSVNVAFGSDLACCPALCRTSHGRGGNGHRPVGCQGPWGVTGQGRLCKRLTLSV